jgi:transposase-like protein
LSNFKYISASKYLGTNKSIQSSKLKDKLIKEGIKENKCESCGITEWMGKPITLQLHHINGNHSDNRLENLQILCPNCHSLTDNYCANSIEKQHFYCKDCGEEITRGATYCVKCLAKHHRKVERPSKDELLQLYKELKSLSAIGRKYGVSDKTISKWFISYELPGKASELKQLL